MNANEKEKIVLGSGTDYCMEFEGDIPADAEIETEENRLGAIKGGASLTYKPSTYTEKDDSGKFSKTVTTEEELTYKLGLITYNANVLDKLVSTGTVTEETVNGVKRRTIKIGGVENDNGKKWLHRFVHKDPVDGDVRVTIVGTNKSGFSLAFAKDKGTIVEPEITAEPLDDEGHLVIYTEDVISTDTADASSQSGDDSEED